MPHANAPLSVESRRRLVKRCQTRPIAHVDAEMGISRTCASKWVNRWRLHGDAGLHDRPSSPHQSPNATPAWVIADRVPAPRAQVVRATHHRRTCEHRFCDRPADCQPTRDPARPRQTPINRPRRREQPEAGEDHRPLAWTHGAPGCEEGRPGRSAATSTCTPSSMVSHASPTPNPWAMRRARQLLHYNYHRPHSAAAGQPPAARLRESVTNVEPSYTGLGLRRCFGRGGIVIVDVLT